MTRVNPLVSHGSSNCHLSSSQSFLVFPTQCHRLLDVGFATAFLHRVNLVAVPEREQENKRYERSGYWYKKGKNVSFG